jgi:hypothetical protein
MKGRSRKRQLAAAVAAAVTALAAVALLPLLAACGGGREVTPNQLAYIDADGSIRLVNADGSGAHKIADTKNCGRFPHLVWSPTGDRLTCIGSGTNDEGLIVLMDAQGQELADLRLPRPALPLYWSPGGDAFLYGTGAQLLLADQSGEALDELGPLDLSLTYNGVPYGGLKFWSPDGGQFVYRPANATEMRIYSLDSASERSLPGDYRPLAWVLGGKALLVAAGYQPPVDGGYPTYEASLLDLASGELRRVPALDNGRQFWVSPDGTRAAVLTQGSGGLPGLATLALPSGEFSPIPDSVITYGSDHIPEEWVTFTADGSEIYWITQWESGAAVFRANSDGTGLTKMGQVESPSAESSPDLSMVAYRVYADGANTLTLYTANIDGTGVHEIDRSETGGGGSGFASAWRPRP